MPPKQPEECRPLTCANVGASCGAVSDGCGGTLQCGTCDIGQTCGGGGQAHACGTPNYGVDTACTQDGVCFLNPRPVSHDFKDVWGRSVNDFWAVGNAGYIVHGGPQGLTVLPGDAELSGIWGSAPEDVWAVGSQILHFDGRDWSAVLNPERFLLDIVDRMAWDSQGGITHYFYLPETFSFRGVYPIRDMQAWVVGADTATGQGVLVELNGHDSWTRHLLESPGAVNAIHGTGPDDVWAVGDSLIAHWDGASWTELRTPQLPSFRAVRALERDFAWALGPQVLWRWNGASWISIELPSAVKGTELRALFADSRTELYVAGDHGLLLRYDVELNAWRRIETRTRKSLRALSGGAKTLIVAGEDGTVLRLYR